MMCYMPVTFSGIYDWKLGEEKENYEWIKKWADYKEKNRFVSYHNSTSQAFHFKLLYKSTRNDKIA